MASHYLASRDKTTPQSNPDAQDLARRLVELAEAIAQELKEAAA